MEQQDSDYEDGDNFQKCVATFRGPPKLQQSRAMKGSKYFTTAFWMNHHKESFVDLDGQRKLSSFTCDHLQAARSRNDLCMEITLMCHDIENAYCFGDLNKSVELAENAWEYFKSLEQTGSPDIPFLCAKLAAYSAQAYIAVKQFGKVEEYLELARATLTQTEVCDDSMWTLFNVGRFYRDFLFSTPNALPTVRQMAIDSYNQSFQHYQELGQEAREAFYPEAIDCLLNIARIYLDSPDLPFGRSRIGVVTPEDVEKADDTVKKAEQMLMSQLPKSRRFRQVLRLQLCQGGWYYRKAEILFLDSSRQKSKLKQQELIEKAQTTLQIAKVYVEDVQRQASSTTFSEKKRSKDFLYYLKNYRPCDECDNSETDSTFLNCQPNVKDQSRIEKKNSTMAGDSSPDTDIL